MKPVMRMFWMILCAGVVLWTSPAGAQERGKDLPRVSPNAVVGQTIGITDVTVTYGRPSVRGRQIYGDLVPYGEVWRTGANEATTITFEHDVTVEGQPLAAGTYGLFTIPGEEEWVVIFNGEPDQWGAYQYDEAQDVLRVTVTPEQAAASEMMTFTFEDVSEDAATLVLHWADVRVPVRIEVDTDGQVFEAGREAIAAADDWRVPLRYAGYALERDITDKEVISWIEKAVSMETNYYTLSARARAMAKIGQYEEAIAAGEEALELARAMEERPQNLDAFEALVAEWKSSL